MKQKKTKYPPKELHLVLKHRWYDMIASGEKRQEYRDIDKWARRFCTFGRTEYCKGDCEGCQMLIDRHIMHTTVERVTFHRGYTSTTMTKDLDLITHVSTMFGDTNDRHNRYVLSPLWQGGGYKAGIETTNYTN